jgi:spermidine/putrescine transport system ATP-binding protein
VTLDPEQPTFGRPGSTEGGRIGVQLPKRLVGSRTDAPQHGVDERAEVETTRRGPPASAGDIGAEVAATRAQDRSLVSPFSEGPEGDNVRLYRVTKRYAGVTAVDQLDLGVRSGEFLAILGPSGSGKTTTMRIIAGFVRPDKGRVEIAGRDVTDLPPHRRDVNTVFQSYGLIPHMTVKENVEYGLKVKRVPRQERTRRVYEMLELVRLGAAASRRPSELSGGMQQRVALARALVNRPTVLLLDEPLAALDRKLREDMQVELRRLQTDLGLTFVYVTHDQEEALGMSDRLTVMNEGRVVQEGIPAEVYDNPSTLWIATFVGASNRLDGTVTAVHDDVELDTGATRVIGGRLHGVFRPGQPATAVVRPEHVDIRESGDRELGVNRISARVVEVLNVGSHVKCVARARSGLELQVRRQRTGAAADEVRVGEEVELSWPAHAVHIYPSPVTQGGARKQRDTEAQK